MKNRNLLILVIIMIVMGMCSSAFATLIEITEIDPIRGLTTEAEYADYVNSGDLLGVFQGNDSNQLEDIADWLIDNNGYSAGFVVEESFKDEFDDGNATLSGTWSSDIAISFYVVKASSAFALYDVNPLANAGTWSTYDLWVRNVSENNGKSLQISHITGYNPVAPVPEPATMFLLGTGLLGFAGFRRKSKVH